MKRINHFLGCMVLLLAANDVLCIEYDSFQTNHTQDMTSDFSYQDMTLKVKAAGLNIADNSMADKLCYYGYYEQLSVNNALAYIEQEHNTLMKCHKEAFLDIDLSKNMIGDEGATSIWKYFVDKNILLRNLDLSWNDITNPGIKKLIKSLKPHLLTDTFKLLDITGNPGANNTNINSVLASFALQERTTIINKIKIRTHG